MWRPLRFVLLALLILVVFVEEWGWRPLAALAAKVARWPPLAALERRIRSAPRHVALALFLVPAIALVPVKLVALWLIQDGSATLGVSLIIAATLPPPAAKAQAEADVMTMRIGIVSPINRRTIPGMRSVDTTQPRVLVDSSTLTLMSYSTGCCSLTNCVRNS